ncbi:MAG TPA: class I SAM-dependent methyltransferase [Nitrospira sp.]|nr:class I SAM-dependent methyltransferase [Nitrospira sp.]
MKMFRYNEAELYAASLQMGIVNLAKNQFALGIKKTVGKISQPINSYTRFPEYFFIAREIERAARSANRRLRILDVGSPKMLGLITALKFNADVHLTDIANENLDEYQLMWSAVGNKAKGNASFAREDARSLSHPDCTFDISYSMSVLEHVEGEDGDIRGMSELIRVTAPGGTIIVSVPFGNQYVEQQRYGFEGAARRAPDTKLYFFQRIYSPQECTSRLLKDRDRLSDFECFTVFRAHPQLARIYGALSENVRGLVGFLNPLISYSVNRDAPGITDDFDCSYNTISSPHDIYGDLILIARKRMNNR